jgi:adenosylcobinamide kinase/adenosylcobinamide-phosphate guanylyltransferase
LIFITGPVRSGKSAFAEQLARASGKPVTYVATARYDPGDPEWTARIAHHRARRPAAWEVVEIGGNGSVGLARFLEDAPADRVLLVDSLGTWLADRMATYGERIEIHEEALAREANDLALRLCAARASIILVGEETGWGIVPPYPSGRLFRDILGRLQQRLAGEAERAYLVVDGYALDLRALGRPVATASAHGALGECT